MRISKFASSNNPEIPRSATTGMGTFNLSADDEIHDAERRENALMAENNEEEYLLENA